jgi:mannitol 2-dehydrogenase
MSERIRSPRYARSDVRPGILHFGVGNFHRSHQAMYVDALLDAGVSRDWGIIGVGLLPGDTAMAEALRAQDFSYTLVERAGDGSTNAREIRSIIDYIHAPSEPHRLKEALVSPDIRIVSLTITEGGYNTSDATGEFDTANPAILADAESENPTTIFGALAAGLHARRACGIPPFTIASCDNILENGEVTRRALVAFARLAYDAEFAEWINAEVSFPSCMVDRITPVTGDNERALVRTRYGIDDAWPVICEPFAQWVIEDDFPGGRPPWETVGAQVVTDVSPYEKLKLRLLNGSHQALAHEGLIRGHTFVHDAVADPAVAHLIHDYMSEAAETLDATPGIDIAEYRSQLVARFANPHIGDTLARLATNASDRIPKFLVPVALDRVHRNQPALACAAVVAGWAASRLPTALAGPSIPDRHLDAVTAAALGALDDPTVFLEDSDWFGDLADDAEFVRAFCDSHRGFVRRLRLG